MHIIANNVASKLFVAFVAAAMLFTLATPAKAATAEELQAQIAALMAQIASLQGGGSSSAAACAFTRALTVGSQGEDVKCLQDYLAGTGHFSNAGGSTGYFGPVTQAAVAAWQAANGVSPAAGYFGPISQAKYSALVAMSGGDDAGDDDDDSTAGDDDDDSSSGDLSGEASLDNLEISAGDDDEVEEGEDGASVAEVDVEFADGDAMITRIDVALVGSGDETDPWDTFEEVGLVVDGDEVATMDASDEDEYLDEDDGTIRFSGLDIVANEDEEITIAIVVSTQGNIDGVDDGEDWDVSVEALRFLDGDDVSTTEDTGQDFGVTTGFTIDEAGSEDELIVKTSESDPDGTTLQLEDDAKSDWFTLFAFDLDTDDSISDIELNSIPVTVTVSSSTYNTLIDEVELVIDGTTIDDISTTTGGATSQAVVTFDVDGDVVIEAGERVTAELMVRFNALALGNEGVTASGTVTSANADAIDAEGADDLDDDQTSGAATGDDHTLRTAGVDVEVVETDADVTINDSSTDDYGTFVIEMDVTAFEQDVYISTNPATSISYTLEDGAGSTSVAGTRSVTLTSTGDEEGSAFEITEGSTETITLTVTYTPGVANTASRLQLNSITFGSSSGTPTGQSWTASPDEDYRTAVITMVN